MDYSRKISERLWNMPDKGELESRCEETFIDKESYRKGTVLTFGWNKNGV